MDINFSTNTTLTLLNRLGRSAGDDAFVVDSSTTANLEDAYNPSGATIDNFHTLIIRDTLETGGYMYGAINLYTQQLDQLSSYLLQLRDKEIAILSETDGSAAHTQLLADKQTIEEDMSAFIGQNVHLNDLNLSADLNFNGVNSSFMDVIDIHENSSDPNSNIVGLVSSIEVELLDIFSNMHSENTCPHCIEAARNSSLNINEGPQELATSSSGGATSDKTYSPFSATQDQQVEALRSGAKWNISGNDVLTYSFYEGSTSPDYPSPYPNATNPGGANGNEVGISDTGPDNATHLSQMMGEWEKAVDFEFQQILEDVNNNNNVGDIRMAFTTDGVVGGRAAYAYYPSSSAVGGDVWFETHDINSDFDPAGNDFNSLGLGGGGYSWYAALHEVGHALGLSHPFLNANNQPSAVSGVVLPLNEDNMRTSVMSYTQFDRNMAIEWNGSSQSTTMVYATTPMLADVKAVELMYGAETTSDGDTTYNFSLDGSRLQPLMMQTIIDSGGVDTIDLSNQTRTNILNMNGDTLSSIGYWSESDQVVHWASVSPYSQASIQGVFDHYNAQATAGKATSMIYTGEHNLGIAKSAQIENAIGGSADDTITGNALDNMITGGGGNDTIDGGEGNDVAIFSGNKGGYNISTIGDTTTVSGGADGTDTLTNIEFLQFTAGAASARGASIRTSLTAVTNLSGTSHFDVSVDGGASVNVTFNGQDYTSGGLSMNDLMADLQTAINSALANDGQSASVTVSQNSPLQITSNNTGGTSAISLSSLSGPLQAALGNIENEGSIENGDTIYYAIGGGYITSTPSGNFTPTNPTPSSSPTTPTTPTLPTTLTTTPTTPTTTVLPEVIEANPPGLPSHISGISLATQEDAAKAIMVLDRAIEQITQSQAKLGAIQNRLDYTITNLTKNAMLTEAAKGRITDADFAAETAILVKNQILSQAATQALNMANQSRQSVMGLIS